MRNIAGTLLAAAALVLAACSQEAPIEDQLKAAQASVEAGEYAVAAVELRHLLQQDPDVAQARWLLAQTGYALFDYETALKEVVRARQLGFDIRRSSGLLAMALFRTGDLEATLDIPVPENPGKLHAEVLAMQGLAHLARGELDQAEELLLSATALAPDNPEVLIAEARLYAARGEYFMLRDQLDRVYRIQPENVDYWILLGDLEQQQKQLESAEAAYSEAVRLHPGNAVSRLSRASNRIQQRDFTGAQSDIDVVMKMAPQSPMVNYLQGLIYLNSANYSDAVLAFAIAEQAKRELPLSLFFSAISHYELNNPEQAERYATAFHQLQPDHLAGTKLLASIELQQRDHGAVEELLRPILDVYPNDPDILGLLGNALLMSQRPEEGMDLLSKAAELRPESASLQVRVGVGMLIGGRDEEGVAKFETAIALDPDGEKADIMLALAYMRKQDFDAAVGVAKKFSSRQPANIMPYILLGKIHSAAGNSAAARVAYETALKLDSGSCSALHGLARLAAEDNNFDEARTRLQACLVSNDKHVQSYMRLASLAERDGDMAEFENQLQAAVEKEQEMIEPALRLGRYYLLEGRPEKVIILFNQLTPQQQQRAEVLNMKALAYMQKGEYAEATQLFGQISSSSGDSVHLLYQMAIAEARSGNLDQSKLHLARALELDPNFFPGHLSMARLALSTGDTSSFGSHLQILEELAPEHPDVLQLKAARASKAGDSKLSLELSRAAYEARPDRENLLMLAAQLRGAGQVEAAQELIAGWLASSEDNAVRIALAAHFIADSKADLAVEQYELALLKEPGNVSILNNLAWTLREINPEKALQYARQGAGSDKATPEMHDTLAVIYLDLGDIEKARQAISAALAGAPNNSLLLLRKADIEARNGNTDVARELLTSLLNRDDDFAQAQEARDLLNSLAR